MNMLMAIVHALRAMSWTPSPAAHPHVTGDNIHRTRRWAWLGVLFLGGVLLLSGNAHADPGTCAWYAGSSGFSQQTPLSGSLTVGRDLPVGSVIYQATVSPIYPGGNKYSVVCSATGTYNVVRSYVSTPYPLASYVSPSYGNVYQTSVPGIGVVIVGSSNAGSPTLPAVDSSFTQANLIQDYTLGQPGTIYQMFLIKTGPVSPGTLTGNSLPVTNETVGTNSLVGQVASFTGSINIVAATCVTPDVTVPLGTHTLSELTGVGSSTGLVNVPIQLNNCPAFYGQSQIVVGGAVLPVTPNTISFQVNPTTSVVNASQGVMALTSAGSGTTATGMGIQMLNASGVPIQYGTVTPSGLALSQVDGASYTINLQARYYQTAATTTAGQANGSATVTLIYN